MTTIESKTSSASDGSDSSEKPQGSKDRSTSLDSLIKNLDRTGNELDDAKLDLTLVTTPAVINDQLMIEQRAIDDNILKESDRRLQEKKELLHERIKNLENQLSQLPAEEAELVQQELEYASQETEQNKNKKLRVIRRERQERYHALLEKRSELTKNIHQFFQSAYVAANTIRAKISSEMYDDIVYYQRDLRILHQKHGLRSTLIDFLSQCTERSTGFKELQDLGCRRITEYPETFAGRLNDVIRLLEPARFRMMFVGWSGGISMLFPKYSELLVDASDTLKQIYRAVAQAVATTAGMDADDLFVDVLPVPYASITAFSNQMKNSSATLDFTNPCHVRQIATEMKSQFERQFNTVPLVKIFGIEPVFHYVADGLDAGGHLYPIRKHIKQSISSNGKELQEQPYVPLKIARQIIQHGTDLPFCSDDPAYSVEQFLLDRGADVVRNGTEVYLGKSRAFDRSIVEQLRDNKALSLDQGLIVLPSSGVEMATDVTVSHHQSGLISWRSWKKNHGVNPYVRSDTKMQVTYKGSPLYDVTIFNMHGRKAMKSIVANPELYLLP